MCHSRASSACQPCTYFKMMQKPQPRSCSSKGGFNMLPVGTSGAAGQRTPGTSQSMAITDSRMVSDEKFRVLQPLSQQLLRLEGNRSAARRWFQEPCRGATPAFRIGGCPRRPLLFRVQCASSCSSSGTRTTTNRSGACRPTVVGMHEQCCATLLTVAGCGIICSGPRLAFHLLRAETRISASGSVLTKGTHSGLT